jgi:hypothetical protein
VVIALGLVVTVVGARLPAPHPAASDIQDHRVP